MSETEQFVCLDCFVVGFLVEGRCQACSGVNVISAQAVQASAEAIKVSAKRESKPSFEQKWYYLAWGPFETVISYTKASNPEEALKHACSSLAEWSIRDNYFLPHVYAVNENEPPIHLECKVLNREEFKLWARKKWPVFSELSGEESKL